MRGPGARRLGSALTCPELQFRVIPVREDEGLGRDNL